MAKFIFPEKEYTSLSFQGKLYSEHRMLCQRHFKNEDFTDNTRSKLLRTAVPVDRVIVPVISTIKPIASSSSGLQVGPSPGPTIGPFSNGTAVSQSIGPTDSPSSEVGPSSGPKVGLSPNGTTLSPSTGSKVGLSTGPIVSPSSRCKVGQLSGPKVGPLPEARLDQSITKDILSPAEREIERIFVDRHRASLRQEIASIRPQPKTKTFGGHHEKASTSSYVQQKKLVSPEKDVLELEELEDDCHLVYEQDEEEPVLVDEEDEPQVTKEEVGPFSWQKPTADLDCDDDDIQDDDVNDHIVDSGQQPQKVPSGRDEVADVTSPRKPCVCESVPCECVSAVYKHEGYCCNVCGKDITGFRYVCVQCSDFDLCSSCEYKQAHCQHYVLRVPPHRTQSEVAEKLRTIRRALLVDAIVTVPNDIDGASIEIKEEEEDPMAIDDTTTYKEGDQHCLEKSNDSIGLDSDVPEVVPPSFEEPFEVDRSLHKIDPNLHKIDQNLQELDPNSKEASYNVVSPETIELFVTRPEVKDNTVKVYSNFTQPSLMDPNSNTVEIFTKTSQEDPNTVNVNRPKIEPLQSTPKIIDNTQTVLLFPKSIHENPIGVDPKKLKITPLILKERIPKQDLVKSTPKPIPQTNKEPLKIIECVNIMPVESKIQNSRPTDTKHQNSPASTKHYSKDHVNPKSVTLFPNSPMKKAREPEIAQNQGIFHIDQNLSMYEDVLDSNLLEEEDSLLESTKYEQKSMAETGPIQESTENTVEVDSDDEVVVVDEETLELLQGMREAYVNMKRLSDEEIIAYTKRHRLSS